LRRSTYRSASAWTAPIRSLNTERIAFGDTGRFGEPRIDGAIDRQTYDTHIAVHAAHRQGDPLMVMRLACRVAAPPI